MRIDVDIFICFSEIENMFNHIMNFYLKWSTFSYNKIENK